MEVIEWSGPKCLPRIFSFQRDNKLKTVMEVRSSTRSGCCLLLVHPVSPKTEKMKVLLFILLIKLLSGAVVDGRVLNMECASVFLCVLVVTM